MCEPCQPIHVGKVESAEASTTQGAFQPADCISLPRRLREQ